jgi:hypothetical protein
MGVRCYPRFAPLLPTSGFYVVYGPKNSVATTGRYLHARPTDSSARHLAV